MLGVDVEETNIYSVSSNRLFNKSLKVSADFFKYSPNVFMYFFEPTAILEKRIYLPPHPHLSSRSTYGLNL